MYPIDSKSILVCIQSLNLILIWFLNLLILNFKIAGRILFDGFCRRFGGVLRDIFILSIMLKSSRGSTLIPVIFCLIDVIDWLIVFISRQDREYLVLFVVKSFTYNQELTSDWEASFKLQVCCLSLLAIKSKPFCMTSSIIRSWLWRFWLQF